MAEKAGSDLVRRQNRYIVLQALRQNGPLARVELGRATGLSPASITSICSQLMEEATIRELEHTVSGSPRPGRPITKLTLNATAAYVAAIKLQVDLIEVAVADFGGNILKLRSSAVVTSTMPPEEVGHILVSETTAALAAAGIPASGLARIGVAVPGLADTSRGLISWSPAFQTRDIPVVAPLAAAFPVECQIANDAIMMAEGLAARERPRRGGISAAVFMGYGLGMGILIDGRPFHGATGVAAELGHMNHMPNGAQCRCGRRGCLEAYTADYAIVRMAEGGDDAAPPPAKAVPASRMRSMLEDARAGKPSALRAYEQAGEALGYGLARVIALLNPDRITVAGPSLEAIDFIAPAMRRGIKVGVIDEMSRTVQIETVPFDTDLIVDGTIASLLEAVSFEILTHGPFAPREPVPVAADA